MADIQTEMRDKMRRTINQEFGRMEDDFDTTRSHREELVNKLMGEARKVTLTDDKGNVSDTTDTGIRVIAAALKALTDVEKSSSTVISLKLRQSEQEIASAAVARDRIAVILKATAPGQIQEEFPSETLESHLAEMFDDQIKDFETKISPRDLDDE